MFAMMAHRKYAYSFQYTGLPLMVMTFLLLL